MAVKTGSLLFATLKNIHSSALNRKLIGYTIEKQLTPVTPDHIRRYAEATRDMNPSFFTERPVAPPFFLSSLIWDHIKEILIHPELHLNFFRLVHAEQEVRWHSPIRAGDTLGARITIRDIIETRAGEMLKISGAVFRQDGSMAAEATAGLMIRKKHGPGGPSAAHAPEGENFTRETARLILQTEKGQNIEYAGASGDTSFIHTSDFMARVTGLPGAIMHGICLLSMASSAHTAHFLDNDITRLTGAFARFSRPAMPGETLSMICMEGPPGQTPFTVVNQSGKTILSRGIITYKRRGA